MAVLTLFNLLKVDERSAYLRLSPKSHLGNPPQNENLCLKHQNVEISNKHFFNFLINMMSPII